MTRPRPTCARLLTSRAGLRTNRASLSLAVLLGLLLASYLAPGAQAGGSLTSINESGSLTLEHNKGATIDERGRGSGTFSCNVYIQMTLNGTLVTAQYSAYPHGGSLIGTATAHIHSATTNKAYFSGSITLKKGTGSYSHPSGTASFSGTINRTSYAMTVKVVGRVRL